MVQCCLTLAMMWCHMAHKVQSLGIFFVDSDVPMSEIIGKARTFAVTGFPKDLDQSKKLRWVHGPALLWLGGATAT